MEFLGPLVFIILMIYGWMKSNEKKNAEQQKMPEYETIEPYTNEAEESKHTSTSEDSLFVGKTYQPSKSANSAIGDDDLVVVKVDQPKKKAGNHQASVAFSAKNAAQGIVWAEILGPPKAKQKR
ncbi:hypothetical protein [Aureibacillus halotolerans]|uniref:Uncharacterized protein n=1 Tax=Aureibacillus halotolerans TaxID=1508390 RepID=A0A4R6U0Z4_9BACI|nr:hypothetical protein [Aureibacillus halotolerans]TDQ38059.1 hypothetical protein EV213_111140 [Aureibacillus halotolerans]